LVTIDDANANGTDDLAMLWTAVDRDGARSKWIQVTDGGSGAVLSRRTVLDGTQIPLELLALPSNPRQGGPRLVIASQRDSDGWPSLTIVDARSSRIYLQTNSLPLDSRLLATRALPTRAIPRTERLALLVRNLTTGELRIHVLDASSGAELGTHALLGTTSPASSPTGLASLEIDATDGVAAFTGRSRDGSAPARIEVVRIADGTVIASLSPEPTGFAAMEVRAVADQLGDGVDDLAIRMRSPTDGLEVVQLLDLPTTSVLSTITVLSPSAASRTNGAGVFQFDVLTVGGRPAVAALTAIDGGLVVTVYDLYTGSPLHETHFSGAPQAYRNHFSTLGPEGGKAVALAVVLENTATAQHSIETRDIETGGMTTVLEVGGSKPGGTGATGLWSLVFLSLVALRVARARRFAAARRTPPAVTRRLPERACRDVVSADRQPE
jgi:hypothetical protein